MALSDSELLDAVKTNYGRKNDVELAQLLRTAGGTISEVRAGRRKLPDYNRVLAYDLLGYGWARMVLKYVFHEDQSMHNHEATELPSSNA